MTSSQHEVPRVFRRLFQRLFPTPMGADACEELAREYASVRRRHNAVIGILWCVVQVARPSTWALAWKLSGRAARVGSDHSPVHGRNRGLQGSWLDVKLGYRLLKRYPVLAIISVLSISVTVGIAAAFFAFSQNFENPILPVPEGERLVGIQRWDIASNRLVMNALYDFGVWRDELQSVEELGVFVRYQPNLITSDGRSEPVRGSRITASALGTARVSPHIGRLLVEADQQEGAEEVVVLGFDVWQRMFAADSSVLGQTVRLGPSTHEVIGVMPPGFRFPYNDDVWVPLRENPSTTEPGGGPVVMVVGRLAQGSTLESAQTELAGLGLRLAQDHPETHATLRPRLAGYGSTAWSGPPLPLSTGRTLLALLLVVVCANVGALVYARNATRMPEITIRRALGASRGRLLVQLLVEGAVLASLGAILGVQLARWGLDALAGITARFTSGGTLTLPYWWSWEMDAGTLYYVAALTVLGAVVVGLFPAVKLTRRPTGKLLKLSARGAVAPSIGGVTKAAIALQVGLSVGLLSVAANRIPSGMQTTATEATTEPGGLEAERYLVVDVQPADVHVEDVDRALSRTWQSARALKERLTDEPKVGQVTLASAFPGMTYRQRLVEVEGGVAVGPAPARTGQIDSDFLSAMGAPLLAGRDFNSGDGSAQDGGTSVTIINESFARRFLGDENPIGRRVRFVRPGADPGPWIEIVGLVRDLGMSVTDPESAAGLYLPLTYDNGPIAIGFGVTSEPAAFEARLRSVAAEVDGLRPRI